MGNSNFQALTISTAYSFPLAAAMVMCSSGCKLGAVVHERFDMQSINSSGRDRHVCFFVFGVACGVALTFLHLLIFSLPL